ncbi:MAG: T9SS type A sorting domain-containing protein [Bacteroidetes bacterium]|nr:T9SS type A sorting domain-containing protein [Bacteroidota bacterium]
MKILHFLLISATLWSSFISAQNSVDFSWTSSAVTTQSVSPPVFPGCDTATRITLSTQAVHIVNFNGSGPYSSGQPITSALIPSSAAASSLLAFDITISFSTPVASCELLVRDIDDEYDDGFPEETLSNFSVTPSSINTVTGTYNWNGSTLTPTDNNIRFWVQWNTVPITSVTFRYNRSIVNYALLLDSIRFTCFNPKSVSEINNQPLPVTAGYLPALQALHIEVAAEVDQCNFNLYAATGQLVYRQSLSQGMHTVPLQQLSPGLYIAEFYSGQRIKRERFFVCY